MYRSNGFIPRRRAMSYRHLHILLGIILVVVGLVARVVSRGCLARLRFFHSRVAHGRGSHRVFGKRADATLPFWSWLAFFPLLLYITIVWHLARLFSAEPRNAVTEDLVVGRRLLGFELKDEFDNFVDLTAGFVEPSAIRATPSYRSFPILDGAAPTPEALRAVVAELPPGRTFVHCAQGHGRTGLFSLAVFLSSGIVRSVDDGLRMFSATRPAIRLNREQYKCIRDYAQLID